MSHAPALTLQNVRPYDGGEPIDVVLRDGLIARVAPAGTTDAEGETVDGAGRWIGPGLWDAHVHFTQHVIGRRRVDLSETRSAADVLDTVVRARANGWPLVNGMLMGYGFRDGLWPEPTTLAALDAAISDIPVVLVSGDLHCGWMNRAAEARFGLQLDETGLLREGPWIELMHEFDEAGDMPLSAYQEAADAAASRGVVGVVEYEHADNVTEWSERTAQGLDALRVDIAVWPDRLEAAIAQGLRTGDIVDERGLVEFGRLKVVVDGSLNTRTAWCWDPYPGMDPSHPHACGLESVPIPELRRLLTIARAGGVEAAVHAIGDRANTEVLDTFEALDMRGVIEHAQLVREDDFARFAELGLIASVQPEHAMDDRDVADHHWAGRTARAFAFGSLHRAGAALRLGSDAPVAPLDPWISLSAATARSRGDRDAWHPEQRLPLDVALGASVRSSVAVGQPADLVISDSDPYAADRDELRAMPVAATLLGGRFTWREI
ncbi:N-substituted formamide deformylase [Microbacterium oxydans]|uniref:N-substituted formamide deformylase n=1 Tax=Microbacterium oxydans TaxID=82380 RepID=A0A0F0LD99_9MICO|nr:amidohydrolase family protein [Microbacterium oxydans]KJL30669.1 N-substituted formamide deformylase precursor [Microbacterium oxydans]CAH0205619.1 N-substituted formamide deformylase [Microbacterium oxydans]